jgi:hypothetical protein
MGAWTEGYACASPIRPKPLPLLGSGFFFPNRAFQFSRGDSMSEQARGSMFSDPAVMGECGVMLSFEGEVETEETADVRNTIIVGWDPEQSALVDLVSEIANHGEWPSHGISFGLNVVEEPSSLLVVTRPSRSEMADQRSENCPWALPVSPIQVVAGIADRFFFSSFEKPDN